MVLWKKIIIVGKIWIQVAGHGFVLNSICFSDELLRKYQVQLSGKTFLKTPSISTYQGKRA
jgi:hypothetical protein